MGRHKKNIFADAVDARDLEQARIEEKVAGGQRNMPAFKNLAKDDKLPTTVILSRANHLALKRCALERGTTFSELINGWIEENCADFLPKA